MHFSYIFSYTIKGQPLHLVPPNLNSIDNNTELLKVEYKGGSETYSITIQDNTFYLTNVSDGTSNYFPMGNKTIQDLCNMINKKFNQNLVLSTGYPHIDASRLETFSNAKTTDSLTPIIIRPEKLKPTVAIDFGLLFALPESRENDNSSSLLSQSGFNLDLIGYHKFNLNGHSLYTTLRIGFASNLNLVVNDSSGTTNTSNQIESAIRLANQANLSSQIEFIPKLFENNDFQFGIYVDAGLNYTRLKQLDPTNFRVLNDTTYFKISEKFSTNAIENYKTESDNIFPIGHLEVGINFRFQKSNNLIFYGGFGWINRPIIERGLRFNKLKDGTIDGENLFLH